MTTAALVWIEALLHVDCSAEIGRQGWTQVKCDMQGMCIMSEC